MDSLIKDIHFCSLSLAKAMTQQKPAGDRINAPLIVALFKYFNEK